MTPADLRRRIVDLLAATEGMSPQPWASFSFKRREDVAALTVLANSRGLLKEVADYLGDAPGMEEVERLVDALDDAAHTAGWDGRDAVPDDGGPPYPASSGVAEARNAARTRLLAAIRAMRAPMTVGAALALPEVQDGSHVIEWTDAPEWFQVKYPRAGGRLSMDCRIRGGVDWRGWQRWQPWAADFLLPCRTVPIAEADADPATRGDLP